MTVADRLRRVLVEVARLEREHPIEGMLSLVDQERPPRKRLLSQVAMPIDLDSGDEAEDDQDHDEHVRHFKTFPREFRRGMYFRHLALSTKDSRRTLQKIYNLEVRACVRACVRSWCVGR